MCERRSSNLKYITLFDGDFVCLQNDCLASFAQSMLHIRQYIHDSIAHVIGLVHTSCLICALAGNFLLNYSIFIAMYLKNNVLWYKLVQYAMQMIT